jgi:diphosphomevalonate decarboxylase
MAKKTSTAISHPNIALIKYWGNLDHGLRIPANSSLSMTLGGLETRTTVSFNPDLDLDEVELDDYKAKPPAYDRVVSHLDKIRAIAGIQTRASVQSHNSFPTGTGIASSASGFAALTIAACAAADIYLPPKQLSIIARQGSGSAARSILGGFVELKCGPSSDDTYAVQVAPPEHWDLLDLIAVISSTHKEKGSSYGHNIADTSPLQAARVEDAARRMNVCRSAILERDFPALAKIVELDSNMMHAVMQTSTPPLIYVDPASIDLMKKIEVWREEGLQVCYTLDAGPNVHCICTRSSATEVLNRLRAITQVLHIYESKPGEGTALE